MAVVVQTSDKWNPSGLTFEQAAASIAGVGSGASQGDILQCAKDSLTEALQEWDLFHHWDFLRVSVDITFVVGQANYALPSDFRAEYSGRISGGSERPLHFIRQGEWDKYDWSQQIGGHVVGYGFFARGRSNEITFFPTPNDTETATIRYFRPMSYPTADTDIIDLPNHFVAGLKHLARALFLAKTGGPMRQLQYYEQKGQIQLRKARGDDLKHLAEIEAFIPHVQHSARRLSLDDPNRGGFLG